MSAAPLHEFIPVLRVVTGRVILISVVGLLPFTMANRLGSAINHARELVRELREGREAACRPPSSRWRSIIGSLGSFD